MTAGDGAPDRARHAVGRLGHERTLRRAIAVLAVVLLAEAIGGLLTGSLALLADAGHVLTDLVGVASALVAVRAARRGAITGSLSFGLHRLEVLVALGNALLLGGVGTWIAVEAAGRLAAPPPVDTGPMLAVAAVGLVANLVVLRWFGALEGDAMHIEGARLEVLADTLGSVAVLVGAAVVAVTGWDVVDPLLAIGIGVVVLPRVVVLARRALRVLLQTVPDGVDLDEIGHALASLSGVDGVHDLHAWTLTSGIDVASAHLALVEGVDRARFHSLLDDAHAVLRERGLDHATVQLEPPDHHGCDPHADWVAPSGHHH